MKNSCLNNLPKESAARDSSIIYRPDIDGLRALAVIGAIGFHTGPRHLPGGFVGVDVFFVISGFLITGIILRGLENGTFSFWDFYARRIRRIFPALTVVLLATVALGGLILLPGAYEQLGRHVVAGALFSSNFLLWSEAGYFDTTAGQKPLLHLWSLGVEEQFYLLWPITLLVMWRARRHLVKVMGALALASWTLNVILLETHPTATFYLPFTRFWELLAGGLLAVVAGKPPPRLLQQFLLLHNVASFTGLALVVASIAFFSKALPYPGWHALLPTIGTVLIIAAGPTAWLNRRLLAHRVAAYVGRISYPLYLWHWPFLSYLAIYEAGELYLVRALKVVALVLSLIAAMLTYRFVEQPFRRINAHAAARALAAWLPVTAVIGVVLVASGGFSFRTPIDYNPFAWPETLVRSEACIKRFHQPQPTAPNASFCVDGNSALPPEIIIIGDSHANALYPGVKEFFKDTSVAMLGAPGCPFLRDTRFWTISEPRRKEDCPQLISSAYQALDGRPRTVILASRLAVYLSKQGFGDTEKDFAASSASFDSPSFPSKAGIEFFGPTLARDLHALLDAGHAVTLVLQVPELGFDPRTCIRLRPMERILQRPVRDCSLPKADVEQRQAAYRAIVKDVVHTLNSPKITLLDPMDVLCNETRCYGMKDGLVLYRDDDHLSVDGAKYVWSRLQTKRKLKDALPAMPGIADGVGA